MESWKYSWNTVDSIDTKKNGDPLKSLKVKSLALFGATPTPDMQLSRLASELASGKSF